MYSSITQYLLVLYVTATLKPVLLEPVESKSGGSILTKSASRLNATHGSLVFPKDSHETEGDTEFRIPPELTPTPCPDGRQFCEDADDYPTHIIKDKLKKQPKFLLDQFFVDEDIDSPHDKFSPDSQTELQLCTSANTIIFPKKGKTKEGFFEFIVNDDEHRQGVRIETCTSNGECSIPGSLSFGYKSQCVQKYILRMMVVLSSKESSSVEGIVTKPFEFPSCCSCVISWASDRFGDGHHTPANSTSVPTKSSKPRPKSTSD